MERVFGMTRTNALLYLDRRYSGQGLVFTIGKKAYNRVTWKHEAEGFEVFGEYSQASADRKDIPLFAIYARRV